MNKIFVYGSINIDTTYSVPHIVKPGETISAIGVKSNIGGKGHNQALALKRANAGEVYMFGKISSLDGWVLSLLKEEGVNTSFVDTSSSETGKALIQLDTNGENSIIILGGGNQEIKKEEIDLRLELMEKEDYLVLNGEINNLGYIVEKALIKGVTIALNVSPINEEVLSLPFDKIKYIVVNESEGEAISGKKNPKDILNTLTDKYKNSEIVLTLGHDGSLWGYGKERASQPIFKTDVVDTTGAGDTFFGYFLSSRINGKSAEESLKIASMASSIAVSKEGAGVSIPKYKEVQEKLKDLVNS